MIKSKSPISAEYNSITYGSKVTGEIKSDKNVRIDGELEGAISTSGKLILGVQGVLKGVIHCESAEISGKVEGEIYVSNTLTLRETAVVQGDVQTQHIIIDSKAIFNGSCSMSEKNIKLHGKNSQNGEEGNKEQKKTI